MIYCTGDHSHCGFSRIFRGDIPNSHAELRMRPDWDILKDDKRFNLLVADLESRQKAADVPE